ncbi:hypothetical protein RhiJN_15697 [Ceratobasidium sp. AG-Ba]|nr:hypothetical protein RhiJN_15697 [Ceratobasidium sp. AG-Ba]
MPQSLNIIALTLLGFTSTQEHFARIARNITTHHYIREMNKVIAPGAGFHFDPTTDATSQFEHFTTMKAGKKLHDYCPSLWRLFGILLNSSIMGKMSSSLVRRSDYLTELEFSDTETQKKSTEQESNSGSVSQENDLPDDDWGAESEESDDEDGDNAAASPTERGPGPVNWRTSVGSKRRAGSQHAKQMKRTSVQRATLFTICMSNSSVRCNGLQTVVGMFAHSTNTPSKVIEMMSHAGISVASSTIDRMSNRMSNEAQKRLKTHLKDMLYSAAYDNLEITYSTEQPTITHSTKLAHLTTATIIPLRPGAKKEDLRICKELWARSLHNPDRSEDAPQLDLSHDRLMDLIAKGSFPPEDERSAESLYAWHIKRMLLSDDVDTIAPALKEAFRKNNLGLPFSRGSLEPIKITQIPLSAAEINVSTNHGNATAVENILRQTGISDEELEWFILLMHGDLGTWEHLWSLQGSRSIEATARKQLQFLVFINGWFHTRMAMADSLWRLYIEPDKPRVGHPTSPRSIFRCCTILRPREEGKLGNNPGFRRTHNVIEHVLHASIVDCWRLLVKEKYGVDLKEWKPEWSDIERLSRELVDNYVAGNAYRTTKRNDSSGDMVKDQMRLFNRDALLYVSITRASKYGDVQRMQDLLPLWVYLWRHTKKHKYARYTTEFLLNLDEGWPPEFAKIVQENWLVNPTGKPDGFRGVDWLVERNNFMSKCLYSGSGSNHTVNRLIKESTLIMDYQNIHSIIERSYGLTERTVYHPPPLMKETLARLQEHLRAEQMNSHCPGRVLPREPVNAIVAGVQAGVNSPGASWFANEEMDVDGASSTRVGDGPEQSLRVVDLAVDE